MRLSQLNGFIESLQCFFISVKTEQCFAFALVNVGIDMRIDSVI